MIVPNLAIVISDSYIGTLYKQYTLFFIFAPNFTNLVRLQWFVVHILCSMDSYPAD